MNTLTLYGRAGCHLCEDMQAAVEALREEFVFDLRLIDIEDDPQTAVRYHSLIPVLVLNGREISGHRPDPAALREALRDAGETG